MQKTKSFDKVCLKFQLPRCTKVYSSHAKNWKILKCYFFFKFWFLTPSNSQNLTALAYDTLCHGGICHGDIYHGDIRHSGESRMSGPSYFLAIEISNTLCQMIWSFAMLGNVSFVTLLHLEGACSDRVIHNFM